MSTVASPCVKLCKLDDSGRYCTGCRRTLDEIRGWSSASDEQKQAALDRIATLDTPLPLRELQCERCGSHFSCGTPGKSGSCWCMDMPLLPLDKRSGGDCLCPTCLAEACGQA